MLAFGLLYLSWRNRADMQHNTPAVWADSTNVCSRLARAPEESMLARSGGQVPTGIARDGWQQIDGCSAHHSNRQLQASACVPAGVHSQPIATTWRGSADMACGATYKRPARPVPCLERLMCESTAPWEACHLVHACARWERARALLVCTTLCLVIARARALRSLDPVKFACGQYDRNSGVAQARCGRRRQGPRGHAGDGRELPAKPASTQSAIGAARA